jgi:hypothetical protein
MAKETGEDILRTIMQKGSSSAASKAAEALGQKPEPATPTPALEPQPPAQEASTAQKPGRLAGLTEKLKTGYENRGGAKGIAAKAAIGSLKGVGKLALGSTKALGKIVGGAALGTGAIVGGGILKGLGIEELLPASLIANAVTGAFGGGGNKQRNNAGTPGPAGGGGGSSDSASISNGFQGLQATLNQLIGISNNILSAIQENNSSLQDVSAAIDRLAQQDEVSVRQTDDLLKQLNTSILASGKGGAPGAPAAPGGGGLAGLLGMLTQLMDGFKLLRGALDVTVKGLFKLSELVVKGLSTLGELLGKGFSALKGLFTKGGAEVATTVGAEAATATGTELAEKGAVEAAEKTAAPVAAEAATAVGEKGAVTATESAAELAAKGGTELAAKGGTEVAEKAAGSVAGVAAKGIGSTVLDAIPILGDVAMGVMQGYESGSVGEGIAAGLGSFGGRLVGGAAGATVGSAVPIVGTAAGGFVGEVGGSIAGAEGAAAGYRSLVNWFTGGDKKETSSSGVDSIIADDLINRLDTMHTAGVINDNLYNKAKDDIKNGNIDFAQKLVMQAENSVAPTSNITADMSGINVTPNSSAIPFSQQSNQIALQNATPSQAPVIINNNNTNNTGGGSSSPPPPRRSGAVSTSPQSSHIDRALYGDLYGAGIP